MTGKKKEWKISGSWVARRLEMLQSPAWRTAPRPMKELLEILEVEHMRHKGSVNGHLFKSYTQFMGEGGFNRGTVATMIKVAEGLGFVRINRETGVGNKDLRDASAYTLTYLPTGVARDAAPTDDWKKVRTTDQAERIIEKARNDGKKTAPKNVRRAA